MTRFDPRRISAPVSTPVAAALLCVAVAVVSYLALVAYDASGHTAGWP
jgi:cytochrome c-type biogenesis protein CcmH/NrfG